MPQPIRGQGSPLGFPIGMKSTNLVEDIKIFLPVMFGSREVKNVSANQRSGRPSFFPIGPKNTNYVEDIEFLIPVKFHQILFSDFREVENVSSNHRFCFFFPIGPKYTNLVKDIEFLLLIIFHRYWFRSFRKEVENVKS